MRIGGVGARPTAATDVPTALSGAASSLGQRPAITALGAAGRHEQGFVSLAGWTAKGANLLRDEFGLTPGDRLGVAGPPGWPLAAVALAAWWLGVTVVPAATPGLRLRVVHIALQDAQTSLGSEDVLWLGDALDGTGVPPHDGGEYWTEAVILHPDRPPAPQGDGSSPALDLTPAHDPGSASAITQHELLLAQAADPGGPLGILRDGDQDLLARPDAIARLAALVLRPLVTGAASVVVDADTPDRARIADAERVARWIA